MTNTQFPVDPQPLTPWGPSEVSEEIAPGIIRHDTASHGGYYVSPERVAEMPRSIQAIKPLAGTGWYEEDCDSTLVVLSFPQLFPEEMILDAALVLEHYRPEVYAKLSRMSKRRPA